MKKRGPVVYTDLKKGEIMKSIEGFPHYFITNFGRVLSIRPLGANSRYNLPSKLREITLSQGNKRYFYCNIYDEDGKRHSLRVNRLVFQYHNGKEELQKELVVDHKDNNKWNNHISNLRQITQQQNSQFYHSMKRGTI
jgi:hypothetical protein